MILSLDDLQKSPKIIFEVKRFRKRSSTCTQAFFFTLKSAAKFQLSHPNRFSFFSFFVFPNRFSIFPFLFSKQVHENLVSRQNQAAKIIKYVFSKDPCSKTGNTEDTHRSKTMFGISAKSCLNTSFHTLNIFEDFNLKTVLTLALKSGNEHPPNGTAKVIIS